MMIDEKEKKVWWWFKFVPIIMERSVE